MTSSNLNLFVDKCSFLPSSVLSLIEKNEICKNIYTNVLVNITDPNLLIQNIKTKKKQHLLNQLVQNV